MARNRKKVRDKKKEKSKSLKDTEFKHTPDVPNIKQGGSVTGIDTVLLNEYKEVSLNIEDLRKVADELDKSKSRIYGRVDSFEFKVTPIVNKGTFIIICHPEDKPFLDELKKKFVERRKESEAVCPASQGKHIPIDITTLDKTKIIYYGNTNVVINEGWICKNCGKLLTKDEADKSTKE